MTLFTSVLHSFPWKNSKSCFWRDGDKKLKKILSNWNLLFWYNLTVEEIITRFPHLGEQILVLLKHPGPPLIWEGGPVCFSRSYWRFLAQNWKSYENQIQNQWGKTHLFSYIDLQWNSVLTSFPRIFVFILTLQPDLK